MKCIPSPWLQVLHSNDIDIFDNITSGLLHAHKISQNRYSLLNETCLPENCIYISRLADILNLFSQ